MTDLIIFSSSEQLLLANKMQEIFYQKGATCKVWEDDFFKPSTYTLENFKNLKNEYKKAIVILGKDDCVRSRGKQYLAPRDNVLLELGICIGSLQLKNTFIVYQEEIKILSDLFGITSVSFSDLGKVDLYAKVIVNKILEHIKNEFASATIKRMIMWDEYVDLVKKLLTSLKQSVNFGGFYFELILSVSRGGSVLAGVIARTFGQNMPVLYLQEDRRDGNGAYDTPEVEDVNQAIIKTIKTHKYKHILIVDSAIRSGKTLNRAKEFIAKELKEGIIIKSAVLLIDSKTKKTEVDYYAESTDTLGVAFFYNQFG